MNIFILLIVFSVSFTTIFTYFLTQQAIAQTLAANIEQVKILLNDAIQALQKGNTNSALGHLRLADQQIATTGNSSSSVQTTRTLTEDAIQALQKGNTNSALVHLRLADQQLPSSIQTNTNRSQQNMNTITTTTTSFSTYNNPILGITLQYPSNWIKREYPYNSAANNTIVSFFSQSETASALGNVSGVSGNFVPYLDVFVFPSKNMSLDEALNGTINNFGNNINISESKPIILKGDNHAHMLVYTIAIAGDELFKKMQVWTTKGDRVYVITYSAEEELYPKYLPTIQKMVDSLELRNPILTGLNNAVAKTITTNQNAATAANATTSSETTSGNTVTGIPGLP
jgi:hypothetical protein